MDDGAGRRAACWASGDDGALGRQELEFLQGSHQSGELVLVNQSITVWKRFGWLREKVRSDLRPWKDGD